MAVLKGYIKPLVKAVKVNLPSRVAGDEGAMEEFFSDLAYDAVKSIKGLYVDEDVALRCGDDNYLEIELVVGGFSPREVNANEGLEQLGNAFKRAFGKHLQGFVMGYTTGGRSRENIMICSTRKDLEDSGYKFLIQF